MVNHNKIQNIIIFIRLIRDFENSLIEKYQLNSIPYCVAGKEFPKKGHIDVNDSKFNYNFHGAGCTFFSNNTKISYNTAPILQEDINVKKIPSSIKLGIWGYQEFLMTYTNEQVTQEEILEIFLEFEKEGIIKRISPKYLQFEISSYWLDI